ncbi:hypothetical protein BpHYR1_011147 [Brachionus plicatilis]|uniref:RNA-directed DNA polymerase from mobile element jockey-like n=1 Tax=Brachionus plicatilis TaxID=10195 RepID=A0A3M7QU04_BRAPC|nr:hypothetical protein BpHYR1_011147 [Brachionus plicatilis]
MIIGIPTRCRTKNLALSLKIESTNWRLESVKCDFFIRLSMNKYTKSILENVHDLNISKDLTREIIDMRDYYQQITGTQCSDLIQFCHLNKYMIKTEIRSMYKHNEIVSKINKIFDLKNLKLQYALYYSVMRRGRRAALAQIFVYESEF